MIAVCVRACVCVHMICCMCVVCACVYVGDAMSRGWMYVCMHVTNHIHCPYESELDYVDNTLIKNEVTYY